MQLVCISLYLDASRVSRSLLARLLVVGDEVGGDELARAVRVEVARHVVGLGGKGGREEGGCAPMGKEGGRRVVSHLRLHVLAELVEGGGRDHVALAVDLPRGEGEGGGEGVRVMQGEGEGEGEGWVRVMVSAMDN